jgi:hypothetical protein
MEKVTLVYRAVGECPLANPILNAVLVVAAERGPICDQFEKTARTKAKKDL